MPSRFPATPGDVSVCGFYPSIPQIQSPSGMGCDIHPVFSGAALQAAGSLRHLIATTPRVLCSRVMNDSDAQSAAQRAIARWLEAINARGDRTLLGLAMTEEGVVERCGFGPQKGTIVARIEGLDAICAWHAMSPGGVCFRADGPVQACHDASGDAWRLRYAFDVQSFANGGVWTWRMASDGRIDWLQHDPDDLPPEEA